MAQNGSHSVSWQLNYSDQWQTLYDLTQIVDNLVEAYVLPTKFPDVTGDL